ncbi:MAG: hypothetical protein HQL56_03595 [Magnetococcales bacterium]|nr:hypothetical protein [Magnetococcales bacterium]
MKPLRNTLAALALLTSVAAPLQAGTLETFERSRASLLSVCRDANLSPELRAQKLAVLMPTTLNASQMLVNDSELGTREDPKLHEVFKDYDTSFIVHASREANQPLCTYWFSRMGLTTEAVLDSRKAWR